MIINNDSNENNEMFLNEMATFQTIWKIKTKLLPQYFILAKFAPI